MSNDDDARISRLLDRLEAPGLTEKEQARIEQKIEFIKNQRSE